MSKERFSHHVIIGNSAAAIGAVEAIRISGDQRPITIVSEEPYRAYARHMISRELASDKPNEAGLLFRPESFCAANNVQANLGTKAEEIAWDERRVHLSNGDVLAYDQLLLAVGAKPIVPPFPGRNLDKVFTFTTLQQAHALRSVLPTIENVVVIGGGLIGLQVAESLLRLGKQVTVVELAPRLLSPVLDETASEMVAAELQSNRMQLRLNTAAEAIVASAKNPGSVGAVRLQSGEVLAADAVVLAVGVAPRTELVQGSPVQYERGILVNGRMETSVPGVFAAGDVAAAPDLFSEVNRPLPIWPSAYRQGFTAGMGMTGRRIAKKPSLNVNAAHFFDLVTVSAGQFQAQDSQELTIGPTDQGDYKKLIFQEGRLVGLVATGKYVDQAGFYAGLIQSQVNLNNSTAQHLLTRGDYTVLPLELRLAYQTGKAFNGNSLRNLERRIPA